MPIFDKNGKEYKAKLTPRRERNTPRVVSILYPNGIQDCVEETGSHCFIPIGDYRKLEKKYYQLFRRSQRNKNVSMGRMEESSKS